MIFYFFILLMLFFSYTDIRYFTIPNIVIIPAILISLYFTNNWWPVVLTGAIGALFFYHQVICPYCNRVAEEYKTPFSSFAGGDVKLLVLAGALIGFKALFIFILSRILILAYRKITRNSKVLPYAPFFSIASIPFLWIR